VGFVFFLDDFSGRFFLVSGNHIQLVEGHIIVSMQGDLDLCELGLLRDESILVQIEMCRIH
jgi:hypothetical protein